MKEFNYAGAMGLLLVVVLMLSLIPSCRQTPAISNQIVVTALGIDGTQTETRISVQAVEALKTAGSLSEQNENATTVYQAAGSSVADALQSFLNEAGRRTYILQNQVIALSEQQCQTHTLQESLDYFIRNLEGRALVNLVVCRGRVSDLLAIESGNDAIPADYISGLLREGKEWGLSLDSRLLSAQRALSGMWDAALPILKVENQVASLDGTALFRDGKLIGELTAEQTTGLLFAADELKKCLYTVGDITFRIEDSKTEVRIRRDRQALAFEFAIRGRVTILEEQQDKTVSAAVKEQLLGRLNEEIAAATQEAVAICLFQYDSDPLGLARQAAKEFVGEGVTRQGAEEVLVQSRIETSAQFTLTESGFLS